MPATYPLHLCLLAAGGTSHGMLIALSVGTIAVLIGLIIYLAHRAEMKRTEAFQQVAQDLGLPFLPTGDASLIDQLGCLHLFSRGHSKKIRNMLRGDTEDVELAILDYRYTTGHGKNAHTFRQSVVAFRSPSLELPTFALRPEGLFHKIGGVFGYKDIDFTTHPRFSKAYLLRGDDEAAVRNLFNRELLRFFETQEKVCVEGGGDQLVFYRQSKRIKPDEVEQFMQEGVGIYALFRGSAEA